jgi:hypothetical protein
MSREYVSDCCYSRIVIHVPWVCEWLLFISNCSSCPLTGHELQFEINTNHSHNHGTSTTIRDKQQSLTHSRDMNYNSRLTAIPHTLTRHELQFKINSNHSHTHGTSRVCVSDCCLSRIVGHVPWVCEWLLFISNCSSCPVSVWAVSVYLELWFMSREALTKHEQQFEINRNRSHTHGTWTTIRNKQQSLTHSRDINYNSVVHVPWVCEWLVLNSNCNSCPVSVWVIAVYLEL